MKTHWKFLNSNDLTTNSLIFNRCLPEEIHIVYNFYIGFDLQSQWQDRRGGRGRGGVGGPGPEKVLFNEKIVCNEIPRGPH